MTDAHIDAIASAEVEAVIVRACVRCGSRRDLGQPCTGCGNTQPPEITPLGVVSATHKRWWRRLWWTVARKPLADRRIRRAGQRTGQLSAHRADQQKGS